MEIGEGIPLELPETGVRERASGASDLEGVFREQYPRLINLLARMTRDRSHAEELASEVFCRLAARPMLFRPRHNLEGWLYRTAVNLGLDALKMQMRRTKNEHAAAVESASGSPAPGGPLDVLLRDEERRRVRVTLAGLKPVSARLLLLRHVGLSYRELAETLGINQASVGQMLVRATAEFKAQYRELREVRS